MKSVTETVETVAIADVPDLNEFATTGITAAVKLFYVPEIAELWAPWKEDRSRAILTLQSAEKRSKERVRFAVD